MLADMGGPKHLILGATGGPGLGVFLSLAMRGGEVVGIGRTPARVDALNALLAEHGLPGRAVAMDLAERPLALDEMVAQAEVLISASQPHYCTWCLDRPNSLRRVVAVSSIRLYSHFDHPLIAKIDELRVAIEDGPVPGALVLTTMQTGGVGYNNLERLARLVRLSPVVPLPRSAAAALVQPIHTDDVVYCMLYCLTRSPDSRVTAVGGPDQMNYAALVRRVASALGRRVWTPAVPDGLVRAGAAVLERIPRAPHISLPELARSAEDKTCDIDSMFAVFGKRPRHVDFQLPQQDYRAALNIEHARLRQGMD